MDVPVEFLREGDLISIDGYSDPLVIGPGRTPVTVELIVAGASVWIPAATVVHVTNCREVDDL